MSKIKKMLCVSLSLFLSLTGACKITATEENAEIVDEQDDYNTGQPAAPDYVLEDEILISKAPDIPQEEVDAALEMAEKEAIKMGCMDKYFQSCAEEFYKSVSSEYLPLTVFKPDDFIEYRNYVNLRWTGEGSAWLTSTKGSPVFRLRNPNGNDHHYTADEEEAKALVSYGWINEGVQFYVSKEALTYQYPPVYRLYNPNAKVGKHHFTTSIKERQTMEGYGWKNEGVAWYVYC